MNDSTERTLHLRARPDLLAERRQLRGHTVWSIKDPIALRYYQLREEEYYLLQQLETPHSLAELQRRFESRFAPRKVTLRELESFLATLHREGLLLADAPGQGETLLKRRDDIHRRLSLGRWLNVLALRWRGIDPEPLLDRLYPSLRWVFSWPVMCAALAIVLAAFVSVVTDWRSVVENAPEFQSLLNVRTIVYLGFALGIVKVIHELGHALTCRRVGGECHELGFMLLVFAPCLYVNVTDTWMATSKWKRAAVASAGIVVEVVMAAAAYFVWRFSEPGFLNSLSFSIMAVCSVGTIVFNGNPLLRFDGYYVFSDLLETPNLGEQSSSWLWRGVVRTLFGVDTPKRDFGPPPRTWLLASYSIAALAYRAVVLAVILWGVHQTLSPLGLETLAFALGALVIIGMLLRPATRVYRFVTSPGVRTVKRLNLAVTGAIAVTLLALALWAPLPHRIRGSAIARPKDASRVFVTHAGRLLESVAIGQRVDAGEPLAKLENMELAAEILELRGRRDEQALQVDQLIHQQIVDPRAEDQLPSARQALEDLNRQLEKKLADSAGLQIKAPTAGVVLPAPLVRREPAQNQLTSWSGSPLHAENRGCFLDRGELLCFVGSASELEVLLVVDQAAIQFVKPDQHVQLQFDQLAGGLIAGKVIETAQVDVQFLPDGLVRSGELAAERDPTGAAIPASTSYHVRVELIDGDQQLLIGATGQARISAESRSLAQRLRRYFNHTFGVELFADS